MSARSFEMLINTAFAPETPHLFEAGAAAAYEQFEQAYKASRRQQNISSEELNFRFERIRLGVAIAIIKAYTRLADNEGAKEVVTLLQEALKARSTKEIDAIIQKKITLFDNLYHEIFVNEQREHLLALFEQVLDAGSRAELDELIFEGLEVLQDIDFENTSGDNEEDDDPIDDDFIKSIK